MSSLQFLGATRTVTGSKYLLEHAGFRMLIDCGLFQGLKELRLRNWSPPPVDPSSIDLIVLTHAHLDHVGYLPVLVRDGFNRQVLATSATVDLCGILLPDSGYLQEEEARFAGRHGFSKHHPPRPLYTEEQARRALAPLRPVPFGKTIAVHDGITVRFQPAGHILGAAQVEVRLRDSGGGEKVVLFSGDLGRPRQPLLPAPVGLIDCDHLLVESTYGDRDHPDEDPLDHLEQVVRTTAQQGGLLVIPAFAVGRTQHLLYLLRELQQAGRLPADLPIHVDSPMAIHSLRILMEHPEAQGREADAGKSVQDADPLGLANVHLDCTVLESRALNDLRGPAVIISASGMATGGRILHHLVHRLPDPRNTVLLVGYQAAGTRGRSLQDGAREIKIHGQQVPVRARVEMIDSLSAHADRGEVLAWLGTAARAPRAIHLVHGEPPAMDALAQRIRESLGIAPHLPQYLEKIQL